MASAKLIQVVGSIFGGRIKLEDVYPWLGSSAEKEPSAELSSTARTLYILMQSGRADPESFAKLQAELRSKRVPD